MKGRGAYQLTCTHAGNRSTAIDAAIEPRGHVPHAFAVGALELERTGHRLGGAGLGTLKSWPNSKQGQLPYLLLPQIADTKPKPLFRGFEMPKVWVRVGFHAFASTCQNRFHPVGFLSAALSSVRYVGSDHLVCCCLLVEP